MRFPILVVTGLVCIVLGVAGSEWSRRHPAEKPAPVVVPPPAALTADELAVTEPLADVPADAEQLHVSNAELTGFAKDVKLPEGFDVPGARPVLGGSLFARNATAHGNAVFLISEEGKQGAKQTLLRVTEAELPRALAVHRPGVGALALDGTRLYWSEGAAIFSTDSTAGGAARGLVQFPKARITALGVSGDVLVAALVPKGLDLFSSEPVGAIVSVSLTDGRVKVLASKQVRPAEVRTDARSAVWIAGYPAELWKVELPGGEPKLLSTRADGPLLLEDAFITFRHPVVGSPELVRMSADGVSVVLAKGEVDRVTALAGDSWFSMGGTVSRVDARGEQTQVVARLPQPVLELAATDDALYVVTRQESGGHLLLRLPRSTPQGARP